MFEKIKTIFNDFRKILSYHKILYWILTFFLIIFIFFVFKTDNIIALNKFYLALRLKNNDQWSFSFKIVFIIFLLPALIILLLNFYNTKLIKGEGGQKFILITIFTLITVIISAPFIFTREPSFLGFSFDAETGQIGDTIGGITAPIIGLSTMAATFLAFWVQFKANISQNSANEITVKNTAIDRFESKFLEMIKIHRENVRELSIKNNEGRNVFVSLFQEFHFGYRVVLQAINSDFDIEGENIEQLHLYSIIAYYLFYFGKSKSSTKIIGDFLENTDTRSKFNFSGDATEILGNINSIISKCKDIYFLPENDQVKKAKKPIFIWLKKDERIFKRKFYYQPFTGHRQHLGHYFRHLFQTVAYVDQYDGTILSENDKKKYIKMLRGQLSDFEQLLLYYNAITPLGQNWFKIEFDYINKYSFLKNMPIQLADFGYTPEMKFRNMGINLKEHFESYTWTKM